jgi:hypothetical protein
MQHAVRHAVQVIKFPDLHCRNDGARNSVEKLCAVLALCRELGVCVEPARIGNLWIVPLWSWHHASWDRCANVLMITRDEGREGDVVRYNGSAAGHEHVRV